MDPDEDNDEAANEETCTNDDRYHWTAFILLRDFRLLRFIPTALSFQQSHVQIPNEVTKNTDPNQIKGSRTNKNSSIICGILGGKFIVILVHLGD